MIPTARFAWIIFLLFNVLWFTSPEPESQQKNPQMWDSQDKISEEPRSSYLKHSFMETQSVQF